MGGVGVGWKGGRVLGLMTHWEAYGVFASVGGLKGSVQGLGRLADLRSGGGDGKFVLEPGAS